jgi:glycosyltransferase involved in cell wall biosynthesis
MKILLVNDYATLQGGAEIAILQLRDGLRQRGHDARLFATSAGPGERHADYECFGTTSRWRTLLQTANPWAAVQLRQVLREFRPDVVHVTIFLTQLSPLILPVLRGYPSLYHVVWYRPICPTGTKLLPDGALCTNSPGWVCRRSGCLPWRDFLTLQLQMAVLRRWRDCFAVIVANSEATRQRISDEGFDPIEVIPCGIPETPLRPQLRVPPTAVFAGRLVREKGVDFLLRAFVQVAHSVPGACLWIAGDGPEKGRLEQLTARLALQERVMLLGHLDQEEMARRIARGWVQVVPSLWEEPFGLVAAEAQMRGTAVVATRAGGLMEIVDDGWTGLLVPLGDEAALAAAVTRILSDRELAEEMGQRGRQRARERFRLDTFLGRFEVLYDRLRGGCS